MRSVVVGIVWCRCVVVVVVVAVCYRGCCRCGLSLWLLSLLFILVVVVVVVVRYSCGCCRCGSMLFVVCCCGCCRCGLIRLWLLSLSSVSLRFDVVVDVDLGGLMLLSLWCDVVVAVVVV